ncbi:MAG: hypothetical protein ABII27_00855 [bacterium]
MIKIKSLLFKLLAIIICCGIFIPNTIFAENAELIKSFEDDMSYYQRIVVPSGINSRINFLEKVIKKYEKNGLEEKYINDIRNKLLMLYSENYKIKKNDIKPLTNDQRNVVKREKVKYKDKRNIWKLIGGIVLAGGGTYAAVDGFRKVTDKEWDQTVVVSQWNEDISDPEVTITSNNWSKEQFISWWCHSWWTVENTGNVDITYLDVTIGYYDVNQNLITYDSFYRSLDTGESTGWDDWLTSCGGIEPYYEVLEWEIIDYTPIYETHSIYGTVHHKTTKKKNEAQGYVGIAAAAGGLYLIVDYILDGSRIKQAMNKKGLDIKFAQLNNYFGLMLTKRI